MFGLWLGFLLGGGCPLRQASCWPMKAGQNESQQGRAPKAKKGAEVKPRVTCWALEDEQGSGSGKVSVLMETAFHCILSRVKFDLCLRECLLKSFSYNTSGWDLEWLCRQIVYIVFSCVFGQLYLFVRTNWGWGRGGICPQKSGSVGVPTVFKCLLTGHCLIIGTFSTMLYSVLLLLYNILKLNSQLKNQHPSIWDSVFYRAYEDCQVTYSCLL